MRRRLIIALAALPLFVGPAAADLAKPKPFHGGDYWLRNENTWIDWEVTAPDLPGRLTPDWPGDFQEPGALLPIDWRIGRWPVVRSFTKGERLRAMPDQGGGVIVKDIDGSSWLRVQLQDGRLCFVRANAKFLRPAGVNEAAARRGTDPPLTDTPSVPEKDPPSQAP